MNNAAPPMQLSALACPVCHREAGIVRCELPFSGITSDIQPWPRLEDVCACPCGMVYKARTDRWAHDIARIYDNYRLYHVKGGTEHMVWDSKTNSLRLRSLAYMDFLHESAALPGHGARLLDIGCGTGALLKFFSRTQPTWALFGTEINGRNREALLAEPGVQDIVVGPPSAVPGLFHIITLVHVLEHVGLPLEFLEQVARKLDTTGILLLIGPDYRANPFDLVMPEHAIHFTADSLRMLLARAGMEVVTISESRVPKEILLVARKRTLDERSPKIPHETLGDARHLEWSVRWLSSIIARTQALTSGRGQLGILGTQLAGTWLHSQQQGRFDFFVDEDEQRIGATYLGLPIFGPRDAPCGATVIIAQPPARARQIARRLQRINPRCHWLNDFSAQRSHLRGPQSP